VTRKNRERPPAPVPQRTFTETRNKAPADLDPSLMWHLIFTAPRREEKARDGLEAAGCKVFLPTMHRVITWNYGRRKLEHDVATFPGWLFAAGVPFRERYVDQVQEDRRTVVTVNGRPINDIRDIDGVQGVISNNGRWVRVPPVSIQAVADYQNCVAPPPPKVRFQADAKVRVLSGPFMGFQASIIENVGINAAVADVLVDIFGRSTVVSLGTSQLDAA
jgi:hypothetical protein